MTVRLISIKNCNRCTPLDLRTCILRVYTCEKHKMSSRKHRTCDLHLDPKNCNRCRTPRIYPMTDAVEYQFLCDSTNITIPDQKTGSRVAIKSRIRRLINRRTPLEFTLVY